LEREPSGWDLMYWGLGAAVLDDYAEGYCYLPTAPKHVLKTLDGYVPKARKRITVYRPIEGHWYLYFEFLPNE